MNKKKQIERILCSNTVTNKAKELGFEWDNILINNIKYNNPTREQLSSWLREVHNLNIFISPVLGQKNGYDSAPMIGYQYDIFKADVNKPNKIELTYPVLWNYYEFDYQVKERFKSINYNDAFDKALMECLELINK